MRNLIPPIVLESFEGFEIGWSLVDYDAISFPPATPGVASKELMTRNRGSGKTV